MDQLQSFIAHIGPTQIVVLVVTAAGIAFIVRMFKSSESTAGSNAGRARCRCGWTGTVSRHRPVCPKCGQIPTVR